MRPKLWHDINDYKKEENVEKQILSNGLTGVNIPMTEPTIHTAKILPV